jgi:hypothetical protein
MTGDATHPEIVKLVSILKASDPGSRSEIDAALKRLMDDPTADPPDVMNALHNLFGRAIGSREPSPRKIVRRPLRRS